MVLGVASVATATRQHQTVGMLNSPLDIRLWLSRGRPTLYRNSIDKYTKVEGFQGLPLESSISALKATALPGHLLDQAVRVFLVGFGLYVLLLWLSNPDESGESYRNVFIIFILTVGIYVIYDSFVALARILDDYKRNMDFSTKTLGGLRKPEELLALQKELAEVQQRIKSEHLPEQELRQIRFKRPRDLEAVVETRSSTSSTNRNASPACRVDKYQAWQHYLISYVRTQAASKHDSSLLKIMEMKGSFEAEWDLAIAVTKQETNP